LEELEIASCDIKLKGTVAILFSLATNNSLKRLDVSDNSIDVSEPAALADLCAALTASKNLQRLNLSFNYSLNSHCDELFNSFTRLRDPARCRCVSSHMELVFIDGV